MDVLLGVISCVALGLLALTLFVGMVYVILVGLLGIAEAWEDLRVHKYLIQYHRFYYIRLNRIRNEPIRRRYKL